jgi:hypothetical protein
MIQDKQPLALTDSRIRFLAKSAVRKIMNRDLNLGTIVPKRKSRLLSICQWPLASLPGILLVIFGSSDCLVPEKIMTRCKAPNCLLVTSH